MKSIKIVTIFLAIILLVGCLAGCAPHRILHTTDTLRVERDRRSLVVYDVAGDAIYTLATKRVRKADTEPRSLVETDTITITAQPNLTTITDKTAGTIVTIGRRHR